MSLDLKNILKDNLDDPKKFKKQFLLPASMGGVNTKAELEHLNKHIYKDLKCTDCKQHTKVKLGRKLDGHFFLKIIHLWILQK